MQLKYKYKVVYCSMRIAGSSSDSTIGQRLIFCGGSSPNMMRLVSIKLGFARSEIRIYLIKINIV